MSPLDLELHETIGELVMAKSAKDWTDLPTIGGQAASKGLKKTRTKARAAGRSAKELATDPLFLGSAVGGASLGALLVHKLKKRMIDNAASEKTALFRSLGAGADWVMGKGWQGLKAISPRPATAWHYGVKKPWDLAMEVGGIRGLTNEHELLSLMRKGGNRKAWAAVKGLADAKGMKSPVGAFSAILNPLHTISPRVSEAGHARWLLGQLHDPVKLRQFLIGATPGQKAALKKLAPLFSKAHAAGDTSALAKWGVPAAVIGGPAAYGMVTGGDPGKRPVMSSVESGYKSPDEEGEPNMLEKFWGGAGDRISQFSPGLGEAISKHPYLSTAGAAGAAGAGLYGLFGGQGDKS